MQEGTNPGVTPPPPLPRERPKGEIGGRGGDPNRRPAAVSPRCPGAAVAPRRPCRYFSAGRLRPVLPAERRAPYVPCDLSNCEMPGNSACTRSFGSNPKPTHLRMSFQTGQSSSGTTESKAKPYSCAERPGRLAG